MPERFTRIAAVLRDFADFEKKPRGIKFKPRPCEACGKDCHRGGLCPECIELAAGACMRSAR